MLKYTTAEVTFREIPDEITLCINISNCPIHCADCHSKELWGDIGTELSFDELKLPSDFQYPQHLYDDNGGGQFLIMDGDKQLGRINTYTGKKK